MDFSGLILIPLAAVITACWIIGVCVMSQRRPSYRVPFLLSYGLGVIFMEPWRIAAWQELGMFAVLLVMLVFSVAAGCLVGGIPATLAVAAGAKLRQRSGN